MQKIKVAKLVAIILKIIFYCGIIAIIFIPSLYDALKVPDCLPFTNHTFLYKLAFYSCYLIILVIIRLLINIFNIVYSGSPFNKELVLFLKIIACLFMTIAIIVFLKSLFIPSILSFAVIAVTFIASISFYILSQVFKIAISYKHELDYTI